MKDIAETNHQRKLRESLLEDQPILTLQHSLRKKVFQCFVDAIRSMTTETTTVSLRPLKDAFNQLQEHYNDIQFRNEEQQDAEEFFGKLVRNLHNYLRANLKNQPSCINEALSLTKVTKIKCLECETERNVTPSRHYQVFLRFPQSPTNTALTMNYLMQHCHQTEHNEIDCERCNKRTRSTMQEVIHSTGTVVVIVLARFANTHHGVEKITTMVDFPFELNLNTEMQGRQHFKVSDC